MHTFVRLWCPFVTCRWGRFFIRQAFFILFYPCLLSLPILIAYPVSCNYIEMQVQMQREGRREGGRKRKTMMMRLKVVLRIFWPGSVLFVCHALVMLMTSFFIFLIFKVMREKRLQESDTLLCYALHHILSNSSYQEISLDFCHFS